MGVDETLYNPGAQTLPHSLGNEQGARFSCGKWEDLGPRQILLIASSQVDYSRLAPLKSSQRPLAPDGSACPFTSEGQDLL